jgi:hypothetical protein
MRCAARIRSALLLPALLVLLLPAARAGAVGDFRGLGDLPGGNFLSAGSAPSPDGVFAVGASVSAGGLEAFRWSFGEGMVGLGELPGGYFESRADGATPGGGVVVGASVGAGGLRVVSHDLDPTQTRFSHEA